jgi:hypothetical protein
MLARAVFPALLAIAACGGPPAGDPARAEPPAAEVPPPPRPSPIADDVLRNAEYPLLGGVARLANGQYSGSLDAAALATRYDVTLHPGRGDAWAADGRPWAAVTLQATAGARDRVFAALVTFERGRPRVAGVSALPDGSEVQRLRFSAAADTLIVDLLAPGPTDKRGLPSIATTKRFAVVADTLAPVP